MKQSSLIICNTPYQIMLGIMLKFDYLKDCKVDLIVTDMFADAKDIALKLQESDLFRKVFFVKDKKIQDGKSILSRLRKCISLFDYNCSSRKVWGNKKRTFYDQLYYCIPNLFMYNIFQKLRKENPDIKVYIYEEGYSTYTGTMGSAKTDYIIAKRCKYLKYFDIKDCLKGILLFEPKLLLFDYGCNIIELKRTTFSNPEFIEVVKKVFSVSDSISEEYDAKFILIEESFYMKHPEIDDVELYKKIAEYLGNENVMIKIHPRSVANRFNHLGIKQNQSQGIPWEVLLITQNFQDKVLFALSSGSVINAGLCLGNTINSFLLYKCISYRPEQLNSRFEKFIDNYKKMYPDTIYIPDSVNDMLEQIRGILV